MANFKKYDINQNAFVAVNFTDQIRPGTFEFTLHYLIEDKIDLSVFHDHYKNESGGRTAYDPAIMLKIILFAYSRGITSSRDIQWECEHNIIFKALSCDSVPHFTRIAAFVSQFSEEMETVFEQVLLVCDEKGLIGNELFAIDGCKMRSDASKSQSGTFKELEAKKDKIRKRIQKSIAEHKRLDGRKPSERDYKKKLEQEIDSLDKHYDKLDQFLKTQSPRMGQGKRPKEVKSNLTDNESAKMTTSKGTIQGYNGIAAVDKHSQVITDAQVYGEGQEYHTLQPVLEKIETRFRRLGIHEAIYKTGVVVTADTIRAMPMMKIITI
jgi:transposase